MIHYPLCVELVSLWHLTTLHCCTYRYCVSRSSVRALAGLIQLTFSRSCVTAAHQDITMAWTAQAYYYFVFICICVCECNGLKIRRYLQQCVFFTLAYFNIMFILIKRTLITFKRCKWPQIIQKLQNHIPWPKIDHLRWDYLQF